MPPLPPVTKIFMLACTAVFCAQLLFGRWVEGLLALWPIASGNFMPWQVLTYAFLHGDFVHLFFNLLGIWMFGSEIERLWGQKRFIQMLLAGAIAAALVQLAINVVLGSRAPMVGASGALFALLLCYGVLFPNRTIMPLFPPIPMKARTFVIVFGTIELLMGVFNTQSGIAHFAHLGGMLFGWLMIRYWRGQPPFKPRGPRLVR
jgi:membrane associated rhomboid family serine protease